MGIEEDRSSHPTSTEEECFSFPHSDEEQAAARVDEFIVPSPLMEEGAVEEHLVLDPEVARKELLEQAVTAIDVKPVQPERRNKRRWVPVLVILLLLSLLRLECHLA